MTSASPDIFIETANGFELKTNSVFVFFGKQVSTLDLLSKKYTDFSMRRVRQTHSDIIVASTDESVEADAHYTASRNTALLISTADCLPVMIYCAQTHRACAIHAGWKGVANEIVKKSIQALLQSGSDGKGLHIWLGPHILRNSFEVNTDVLQQLLAATGEKEKKQFYFSVQEKHFVDLAKIVKSQVQNDLQITPANWTQLDVDTKTNSELWSHRRDKEKAGRNLSFISLI